MPGPALALVALAAVGLALIGPRLAERLAGFFGLEEVVTVVRTWLRLPVALLPLAIVPSIVFRFAPSVDHMPVSREKGAGIARPICPYAPCAWRPDAVYRYRRTHEKRVVRDGRR